MMSKALDDLKMLRQKKPALPASDFMTRAGTNEPSQEKKPAPRQDPRPAPKPVSADAKTPAPAVEDVDKRAVEPVKTPTNSMPRKNTAKTSINLMLKVPTSHEDMFMAFAKASNLPVKTVLQAIARKFAGEFKETARTGRPGRTHIEPFTDNVPNCYYKTTVTVDLGDISHIDPHNLLDPKRIYDHWAQHEGAAFVARFLDQTSR